MNRRLEEVRAAAGFEDSLRGFWQELTAGDFDVSYEAVRNYHFNRVPPVEYLIEVARRFGYRLEWLAAGEEPRTREEHERELLREAAASENWLVPQIAERFAKIQDMDIWVRELVQATAAELLMAYQLKDHTTTEADIAQMVGDFLVQPYDTFNLRGVDELQSTAAINGYVSSAMLGLRALLNLDAGRLRKVPVRRARGDTESED